MSTFFSTISNGATGSAVRTILNSLIGNANRQPIYQYVVNTGDQPNSLVNANTGIFSVGDVILCNYYDSNLDAESGGLLKVVALNGAPYGGTLGTLANGGALGAIIEGLNYRFSIVPTAGGEIDVRRTGIRCVESVTGWHSRFTTLVAFAKNQLKTKIVGSGVLKIVFDVAIVPVIPCEAVTVPLDPVKPVSASKADPDISGYVPASIMSAISSLVLFSINVSRIVTT